MIAAPSGGHESARACGLVAGLHRRAVVARLTDEMYGSDGGGSSGSGNDGGSSCVGIGGGGSGSGGQS